MGESRTDLLNWVNNLLDLSYTKVEQCGTGAAYCQILDSIYGDVPMSKVKYEVRLEYEYLDNYKVLQNMFKKHNIDKPIDVERLAKCKVQDNLEFLQWYKKFWNTVYPGDYNPHARRKGAGKPVSRPTPMSGSNLASMSRARPGPSKSPVPSVRGSRTLSSATPATSALGPSSSTAASTSRSAASRQPPVGRANHMPASRGAADPSSRPRSAAAKSPIPPRGANAPVAPVPRNSTAAATISRAPTPRLTQELDDLKNEMAKLEQTTHDIEFERDFYFGKLREIELLIQDRRDELNIQAHEIPDRATYATAEIATLDAIEQILISLEPSQLSEDDLFPTPEDDISVLEHQQANMDINSDMMQDAEFF